MEFDGELKGVSPEKAWVVLSDPMAVRDSLKGCRYITPMGDEFNFDEYGAEEDVEMLPEADPDAVADRAFIAGQKYAALMQVGVGSVKPRFETTVTIEERDDETFEMTASGGGVAYRCSFRVTEAVYLIERMVKVLADELDMDPAEIRRKNFIPSDAFPYESATGWKCDIAGIEMFDSADLRVNPTGNAVLRVGVQTQGQGHETTFAQTVAEELGVDVDDIVVEHGDTDIEPYGLGTYGSGSTPVAGAAAASASETDDEDSHGGHDHDTGASDAAADLVTDPVCGMTVDPETAAAAVEHAGGAYHFCCEGCADSFESDPASYLTEREAASP